MCFWQFNSYYVILQSSSDGYRQIFIYVNIDSLGVFQL